MHHYYRLHFVCQPGGSRKTEYHVLGTLDEVKAAALADLESPEGAYHALFYGEDILLQCWEDGRKVATIDLHPYITYELSDRDEPVRFDGEGDHPAPGFDLGGDDERYMRILDGEVKASVTIAWDEIRLPTLGGTPLPEGTPGRFDDGDAWEYGFHGEWDYYVD